MQWIEENIGLLIILLSIFCMLFFLFISIGRIWPHRNLFFSEKIYGKIKLYDSDFIGKLLIQMIIVGGGTFYFFNCIYYFFNGKWLFRQVEGIDQVAFLISGLLFVFWIWKGCNKFIKDEIAKRKETGRDEWDI